MASKRGHAEVDGSPASISTTEYHIAPNGDTVLVLKNPNAPFAEWIGEDRSAKPSQTTISASNSASNLGSVSNLASASNPTLSLAPNANANANASVSASASSATAAVDSNATINSVTSVADDMVVKRTRRMYYMPFRDPIPATSGSAGDEADDEHESSSISEEDADAPEVRFTVSSSHLVMASAYFKSMLQGPWTESKREGENSPYIVQAHDWDVEALLALLNIIHGRNRQVPRRVSSEFLAKIAALVDYYQCHEAVELFSETWFSSVSAIPQQYGRKLMMRMAAACVFGRHKEIYAMMVTAANQADGPIQTMGMPIPANLVEWMDHAREKSIESLIARLVQATQDLLPKENNTDTPLCRGACAQMQYATLVQHMQINGLLINPPRPPYEGRSWQRTKAAAERIQNKSCMCYHFDVARVHQMGFKTGWKYSTSLVDPLHGYQHFITREGIFRAPGNPLHKNIQNYIQPVIEKAQKFVDKPSWTTVQNSTGKN